MLTFGSLFAGIGGMDLGLERAGFKCSWQVEIDPYARRVLEKHWPDVRRHDDVRTFPPDRDGWAVDLVCGGFPCQDISVAGKGAGIDGERSGLWSQLLRIVCLLRPRFVVVENVAALLDRGMGRVLGDLAEGGFDAEWQVLPASAFGAPHQRERVFLVAYPSGFFGSPSGLFDGRHDLPRDSQWGSTEGLKSGRGWKRWLVQACATVDGHDSDPWFRSLDDGVSPELDADEFRGAGNAVVPQVAEWIGRRILEPVKE
jgi:DNA (cytosine-5)-methyltransferase 1